MPGWSQFWAMNPNRTAAEGKPAQDAGRDRLPHVPAGNPAEDMRKHVPTHVEGPAQDAGRDRLLHVPAENPAEDVRKHVPTADGADRDHPVRRHPARGVHIQEDGPTVVFLTVCAAKRTRWLCRPEVQAALHDIWQHEALAWLVGDYVLMPDHLHLFCQPADPAFSIERWVRYWKSVFSKRFPDRPWEWQRDCFHHRLRHAESHAEKWQYLHENPVEAGLVERAEDWPWRGRVHDWVVQW